MSTSEDATTSSKAIKLFTRDEVARTTTDSKETLFIIDNKVYNVTTFLNEHPGGEEVLLEQAGQDATEPFEDIGHSNDARKMMEQYLVGELVEDDKTKPDESVHKNLSDNTGDDNASGSWRSWLIPIALGVLATLVYRYFINAH